jgi:DNA-directed RNA polymerase subunit M/transcription elongation factor TFIIS
MDSIERMKFIWSCLKPEYPFVETTSEILYELLFKNVNIKTVWELDAFKQFAAEEEEFTSFIITPLEVVEGILKCGKCKSRKILSFSKQIRSGDEPMSVVAKCTNCHHKWIQ